MITLVTLSNSNTGGSHEFVVISNELLGALKWAEEQAIAYGSDGLHIEPTIARDLNDSDDIIDLTRDA